MSGDWLARGRAIGAKAQGRAIAKGVEQFRDEFPGVSVTPAPDAIILSGRGLFRRWVNDARLRAIGSLLR